MPGNVLENVQTTLGKLGAVAQDDMGDAWVTGQQLQELTGLTPAEINDTVSILRDRGLVEWQQYWGTAPFKFGFVSITSRGRFELERAAQEAKRTVQEEIVQVIQRPATPVGSPYGFTDLDWETVAGAKSSVKIKLVFKPLTAGYGEHLFNEIARDIISSDIAVFETSDLNPNVMLEMGVALTWDVRVLPIKKEGQPKPPSDISGQTYADYQNSAEKFVDPDHGNKLLRMVERSAGKKGKS